MRVVVENEFLNLKEEHSERNDTGALSELKTDLMLPKQAMLMFKEVRYVGNQPACCLKREESLIHLSIACFTRDKPG